jgi:hypothetical protein
MCTPKTPKVGTAAAVQPKPQVLTNSYFSGERPAGRDALRTDLPQRPTRGSTTASLPQPAMLLPYGANPMGGFVVSHSGLQVR